MLKDRIVEIGTKRVLLPEMCSGPSESYTVKQLLAILASDRHSVLVTGETGTGKEMLADCVMHKTARPKGKCQRLNCAGLDSNLVGSELFGHKRGAFTGAEKDRDGLLKACDGGILFLDEIGWLLPDLQARLLRFMETGEIRPIGADRIEYHANVRIVAATNKNVKEALIHDLRARFDFEVNLPPLRERGRDILWFLCEPGFLGSGEVFTGITLGTVIGILTDKWGGNIRELRKYCQRKTILNGVEANDDMTRYILEDQLVGKEKAVDLVSKFAGLALYSIENYRKQKTEFLRSVSVRRVAELLVGFFAGTRSTLRRCHGQYVAVIPFEVLRKAANGELPEFGEFDLDKAIGEAVGAVNPKVETKVNLYLAVNPMPRDDGFDFAGAFDGILCTAYAVNKAVPDATESTGLIEGRLEKTPVVPTNAFLEEIGFAGPNGILFSTPPPPKGEEGIVRVLDDLGVKEPDKSIALLCNRGLSNKAISENLGLKTSMVRDHLVNLRSKERLEGYLPKQQAGRRPRKQPI